LKSRYFRYAALRKSIKGSLGVLTIVGWDSLKMGKRRMKNWEAKMEVEVEVVG
jgi:hypothetical protein